MPRALVGKLIRRDCETSSSPTVTTCRQYISGRGSSQRQANVHTAIKMLPGARNAASRRRDIDAA